MMESRSHRPRNVGWARAAALLYGDWGTSKAYVIGAAFLATQYDSLPIILAVGALNFFGPKHSGTMAVALAIPTVVVVVLIADFSAPHLTTVHLEPPHS